MYLSRRYQHLRRYRDIAEVLLRHGYGYLVHELGFRRFLPLRRRLGQGKGAPEPAGRGARLVAALEDLGPTFVKLGQLLSTRPELFPPDILAALEDLQDRVPPAPFERVRQVVEEELKRPLDEAFAAFDPEPLAAASLAQVHRAWTTGGEAVVVKVLRPDIERVVYTDLEILTDIARRVDQRLDTGSRRLQELADQVARTLRQELDYTSEARNTERIAANFRGDPTVRIPRVYRSHTTRRVLTLEFLEGIKVSQIDRLVAAGIDRRVVAERGARAFLKQVLIDGFFHGDPHPGNIFVQPGNTLALVDFGMMGRLDPETMDRLVDLFVAMIRRQIPRVIRQMEALGVLDTRVDHRALRRDLEEIVDRYWGRRLGEIDLSDLVGGALDIARRHSLRLPPDLSLLAKALVTMEGVGRLLDPEFNALEVARPFTRRLLRQRLAPRRAGTRVLYRLAQEVELLASLPEKLDTALAALNRGEVEVRVRDDARRRELRVVETMANRLGLALLVVALTGGGAAAVLGGIPPQLGGVSLPGAASLLLAALLGALLFAQIVRSGHW